MNPVHTNQNRLVLPQPQSYLLNLPKEIISYILSFHPNDRRVLLACRRIYFIGFEVKDLNYQVLIKAIHASNVEIFLNVLRHKKVDPGKYNNFAIEEASKWGSADIVKELIADPRVDPSDQNNVAIRWASNSGYWKVVKVLLTDPRVDPKANYEYPMQSASARGYWKVVKVLLADGRANPAGCGALALAVKHRHWKVAKLLLNDSRVHASTKLKLKCKWGLFSRLLGMS